MRDITLCHPRLQHLATQWQKECLDQGIIVEIGETLRTVKEQDALYEQGRTKPGPIVTNAKGSSYSSQHQWGIAFDFFLKMDINGNGAVTDDAFNDSTGMFERAASVAEKLGLGWGGRWTSIVDKPHLYLPDWGSTTKELKKTYKNPKAFMATLPKKADEGWKMAQDGIRWWYQYSDGSYAKDGWFWMERNSAWYLFDRDGYMLTGLQKDSEGQYFFLWPEHDSNEGKCMVTDDRGALKIVSKYDFDRHRYIM